MNPLLVQRNTISYGASINPTMSARRKKHTRQRLTQ
jgi:hypothetical protein